MTFVATFEAVTQVGRLRFPSTSRSTTTASTRPQPRRRSGRGRGRSCPSICTVAWRTWRVFGDVAAGTGLFILEDACQAHGAHRDGARLGHGGARRRLQLLSGQESRRDGRRRSARHERRSSRQGVRALREHGQRRKYEHDAIGWTSRLDTIQAAVLIRKLAFLDEWNAERRAIADLYAEGLAGVGDLGLPDVTDRGQVWHLYVVRTGDPVGLAQSPGGASA